MNQVPTHLRPMTGGTERPTRIIDPAWSLVREWGSAQRTQRQPLCFPTRAFRAADGTTVIAEERGIHKQVPFRFECRTIRVDASGETLFDSRTLGVDDGFGCLLPDNRLALLRRTHWELLLLTADGSVQRRLPLESTSKRIPRYVAPTNRGTFLVVFYNRSFEIDIAELDELGRLIWFLPPDTASIGIPASAESLDSESFLIADSFRHVIMEIDRRGQMIWHYGQSASPGDSEGRLSSPNSVHTASQGQRLVADTRNHRIVELPSDGPPRLLSLEDEYLCDPTWATELEQDHTLICDTGNARVLEIDSHGKVVWQYGNEVAAHRPFSYPRSIDVVSGNDYIVADTGQNRVVRVRHGEVENVSAADGQSLFWPRCVRHLTDGSLLIADARNGRIVEISPSGDLRRQVATLIGDGPARLEDPHDVRLMSNGHLLVTDSAQDVVLEIDWSGQVFAAIGRTTPVKLKDPHSAQALPDGTVVISDTGHHRLVFVDRDGQCLRELRAIRGDGCCFRLHHPRYAELSAAGTLVISDTGNNRVLGSTSTGVLLWEFSRVPGTSETQLNQPRWATLFNETELLVCDHFHHRLLHVSRSSSRKAGAHD